MLPILASSSRRTHLLGRRNDQLTGASIRSRRSVGLAQIQVRASIRPISSSSWSTTNGFERNRSAPAAIALSASDFGDACRDCDDRCLREGRTGTQTANRLQPVHHRHHDVHQHSVGAVSSARARAPPRRSRLRAPRSRAARSDRAAPRGSRRRRRTTSTPLARPLVADDRLVGGRACGRRRPPAACRGRTRTGCRRRASLSTWMSPPISRTSWWLIARPSPVPPTRRAMSPTCSKGWKMAAPAAAGSMPMPVSASRSAARADPCAAPRDVRTRSTTSPLLGELDRVAQQVEQHLAQALLVGLHGARQIRRDVHTRTAGSSPRP